MNHPLDLDPKSCEEVELSVSRHSALRNVLRAVKSAWNLVWVWQQRIEDRAHLSRLDARLLHDMGFTDDEIKRELRKQFWQP